MTAALSPSQILNAQFTQATLLNVADAIRNVLQPDLAGNANARAAECVTILARIAQELSPDAASVDTGATEAVSAANWKAIVASEGSALDAVESGVQAAEEKLRTEQNAGGRNFDQQRFERYLQQHPLGGSAVKITQSKQLAGGRSKQTILVWQEGAKDLPAQIVVRQDWASAVTGTSVVSEYQLLLQVWKAGLRVPQPLLLEKSAEALGAPFLVVSRIDGAGKGDIFNPPPSEALALQLAEQLAKLHALPVADFERLGVPTEAYDQEQLRAGLAGFQALHAKLGVPLRSIDVAIDWMYAHLPRVDGPKALAHNDLGCHNFLIDGEELTAILDWELAHIGNPAADLGYIRAWVQKMTSWDRFMDHYRAAGGPAVSQVTLDFYTLWCGVRLYCLLLQARAGVAMGAVRDTEITYACAQFLPLLLQRISKELRTILENTDTV